VSKKKKTESSCGGGVANGAGVNGQLFCKNENMSNKEAHFAFCAVNR